MTIHCIIFEVTVKHSVCLQSLSLLKNFFPLVLVISLSAGLKEKYNNAYAYNLARCTILTHIKEMNP